MSPSAGQSGQAAADYLAVVAIVAVLIGGLLALGESRASRRPPLDPIRLIGQLVAPPPRVRPARPRVRPTVRPPRIDRRPVVTAPRWALP